MSVEKSVCYKCNFLAPHWMRALLLLGRLHVEVMDFVLDPLRHSYRAASWDEDTSELRKKWTTTTTTRPCCTFWTDDVLPHPWRWAWNSKEGGTHGFRSNKKAPHAWSVYHLFCLVTDIVTRRMARPWLRRGEKWKRVGC